MLPLACVFVLAGQSVQVDIPVAHLRASRVLSMMREGIKGPTLLSASATAEADDTLGMIRVNGSASDITEARKFVHLVDRAQPGIRTRFHIDSAADHYGYDVTTTLRSNQKWLMTDDDLGLTVKVKPRLLDDGSGQYIAIIDFDGGSQQTIFRLKPGQSHQITLGRKIGYEVRTKQGNLKVDVKTAPTPVVTVWFEGDSKLAMADLKK
jgi:hypothetical protein